MPDYQWPPIDIEEEKPPKEPIGWPWEWLGVGMQRLAEAPPEAFYSAKVTAQTPMGFMGEPLVAPTWGEQIRKYRELPWQQQLWYEAPFWGATMAIPSATYGRAALAPVAAKGGISGIAAQVGRAVLAPPAGVEWLIGKSASFVFGKPIQWAAGKISQVRLDTAFKKWVTTNKLGEVFTSNKRLQSEVRRAFNAYHSGKTETAQQILDRIGEAYPQFRRVIPPGKALVPYQAPSPTTAVSVGLPYRPLTEPLATNTQKVTAHKIAYSKNLISEAGKMKPQYRRFARAMIGKTSMTKMTEAEADTFIRALNKLIVRGNRPPKIPVTSSLITKEFADKIPLFQEIGALERIRPARQVFEKIGLGEEVFWNAFEKEALYGAEYTAIENKFYTLSKSITPERRAEIFRFLEGDADVALTSAESRAAEELRKFFADMAERQHLPIEKRRQNYVTHIFERSIEDDLAAKNPLDAELVRALDFITPKTIFNPYLQKRLGRTVGLRQDPFLAADAYARRSLRKIHYEPLIRRIRTFIPYLPPHSADYLRGYITRITGRPLKIDRELNQTLKEFSKAIEGMPGGKELSRLLSKGDTAGLGAYQYTSFLYFAWLGFKPTSAIRNLSQHVLALAEVGPINFAKGATLRFTAEGRMALKDSIVLKSRPMAYVPGIDESFASRWTDKIRESSLKMFRLADRQNVSDSFLAGYAEAKSLGLPRDWCIKRGDEVVADTQYIYTRLGGASWSQPALGRILSPLTTWPENWIELMVRWMKGRPSHVYERYAAQTGKKIPETMNPLLKRKALLLYLFFVSLAYGAEQATPIRASEYTGWTSIRYLTNIARGELPALDLPGGVAMIIGGALTGNPTLVKRGWNRVRPDRIMGIVRQLENIIQGKADWLSLFLYMDPEEDTGIKGGRLPLPSGRGGRYKWPPD